MNDFVAKCDKQFVTIDGVLSKNPDDLLSVELNDISLDYIFETLNIDNVAFGGRASGKFFGNSLLTSAPRLSLQTSISTVFHIMVLCLVMQIL